MNLAIMSGYYMIKKDLDKTEDAVNITNIANAPATVGLDRTELVQKDEGMRFLQSKFKNKSPKFIDNVQRGYLDRKQFQCSLCHYSSDRYRDIRRHVSTHNANTCNYCGRSFARKETLRTHINLHTGEKPYACDSCPMKFSHPYSRWLHRKSHLTGYKGSLHLPCDKKIRTRIYKSTNLLYQCSLCSYSSNYKANLRKHLLCHTGQKPYKCLMCGRTFTRRTNLKRHIEELHRCDVLNFE
ncbi:transcriptional repressor CTCF-like [Stegodyphus dumicola]|uniref:transcriptional repressor CTCF-like n=1 Tax=Stegodyphus dumicola TaxID=202533 RepID=UPI0015AC0092|nr:transcriptional repressor CTCF-like [Stegodyphus dumicola]